MAGSVEQLSLPIGGRMDEQITELLNRMNALEAEYGKSLAGNKETARKADRVRHQLTEAGYIAIQEVEEARRTWDAKPITEVQEKLNELCRQADMADMAERNGDTAREQKGEIKRVVRIARESFVYFVYSHVLNPLKGMSLSLTPKS